MMNNTTMNTNTVAMAIDSNKGVANTVAMTKGVDFFQSSRELKSDVLAYVQTKVWTKAVKEEYAVLIQSELDKIETQKKSMEKLQGSTLGDSSRELYEKVRKDALATIDSLEKDRDAYITSNVKWERTEAHKVLAKAMREVKNGDSNDYVTPMIDFFKSYNLDIANTVFLSEIINSAGQRDDWDKFVASEGSSMTSFNTTNYVDKAYKKAYEYMVRAGIIKAVDVPEILR